MSICSLSSCVVSVLSSVCKIFTVHRRHADKCLLLHSQKGFKHNFENYMENIMSIMCTSEKSTLLCGYFPLVISCLHCLSLKQFVFLALKISFNYYLNLGFIYLETMLILVHVFLD